MNVPTCSPLIPCQASPSTPTYEQSDYQVHCLEDGVSFVHVSTADTPDGSNPLPRLAAFQEFGRGSVARVATTPVPRPATVIGYYYAAAQLPETPSHQRSAAPVRPG